MTGESQVTFDDVFNEDVETPDELYSSISVLADRLGENGRERAGDNCATVSRRYTDTADEYVFCIQLPPRTRWFDDNSFPEDTVESYEFQRSTVKELGACPTVVWEFVVKFVDWGGEVEVVIVKPLEDPEDDGESSVESYEQFDFTKFVRETF